MFCDFSRRRSWRQLFYARSLPLPHAHSLWSSTSTGEKVATELTLPDLAGRQEDSVFSLECRSLVGLVAHDVTACGCKLQTLVSVNEFKHRYQWTTYVNESEKRTNNFSSLQLQRHCAMTMVRWRVSCGSAQRQLPSMFQVTVHRKRPWRCAHSGFTVNHSFVIHSTQSILPRLLGVRCRVRSPA